MSLEYAILGILQFQPMTGYDLKTRFFDQTVAHFWPADQAQIYRSLDKLTQNGWVESQIEIQEDRPNKKHYSITDAGRGALTDWLSQSHPIPIYRDPFLIQLFFAGQLPDKQIIALIKARLAAHQATIEHYNQIPLPPLNDLSSDRHRTLYRLTLEFGYAAEQTYIRWLEQAIEAIEKLTDKHGN